MQIKNFTKSIFSTFFVLFIFLSSSGLLRAQVNDTTIIDETFTQYFDRSADGVYHVANNSGNPIYSRYYFGTNQNYSEVAQHFDWPEPITESASVEKVEIMGFRMRVAVNTVRNTPDEITFRYYNATPDYFPFGAPLASGSFTSGGLNGDQEIFLPNNEAIEVTSENGFLIGFETYNGDQTEDDIFVLSNSYCVVSGGPNDGRGERRTKVEKLDGTWEDILTNGPAFNHDPGEDPWLLDCDAYVFPFVRITEVVFAEPNSTTNASVSFESSIYPNPSTESINLNIDNPKAHPITIHIRDVQGKILDTQILGNHVSIQKNIPTNHLADGMYYMVLEDGKARVTQNFLIQR